MARLLHLYLTLPVWLRAVAAVAVAGLIWWLSSRTPEGGEEGGKGFAFLHNCAHIVAYTTLGAAVVLALAAPGRLPRHRAVVGVLLAAAYGVVDELHQRFVPGRCSSVSDAMTDLCSAALASCLLAWLLTGSVRARRASPWLLLAALASATAATWLPY